jgi:hypothetical protein
MQRKSQADVIMCQLASPGAGNPHRKKEYVRPDFGRVARAAAAIRQQRAAEAVPHTLPAVVISYCRCWVSSKLLLHSLLVVQFGVRTADGMCGM